MSHLIRWSVRAVAGLLVAALTGCASFNFAKAPPVQTQQVTVKVSDEELSGWTDLPIGTYRVPDSQVIISGHQKGAGAGVLFGLIGVAVAHAANSSAGATAVKDIEAQLHIRLNDQLTAAVSETIATKSLTAKFSQVGTAGAPTLSLTPGIVLSYVSETDMRPYVILKTSLMGSDGKPLWTTRYLASTGSARPLAGPGSWTDDNGSALKASLKSSVEQAVRVLLADVSEPYQRDDNNLTALEGNFPYMKPRMQIVGYKLTEDDRYVAFVPKLGDALVFTGVNVLDKTITVYRAALKDEPRVKLIDPAAAKAQ